MCRDDWKSEAPGPGFPMMKRRTIARRTPHWDRQMKEQVNSSPSGRMLARYYKGWGCQEEACWIERSV